MSWWVKESMVQEFLALGITYSVEIFIFVGENGYGAPSWGVEAFKVSPHFYDSDLKLCDD